MNNFPDHRLHDQVPTSPIGEGIRVEGLCKKRGDAAVVQDVSFVVEKGTLASLLGPSGSGKTTVLRLIAGLEAADAGRILMAGRDCTGLPPQQRRVGLLFQDYALFRHQTVLENIGFGLRVRGMNLAERRKRALDLLESVQLNGFGDRFPDQLSGGQRQRVALARALAPEPDLLLLDEPFSALDAVVRSETRAWVRRLLKARGVTGLVVTHDQEEAFDLSDKVIVMQDGRVAQQGTPAEIYDHPVNEFVARFVGASNVLRGEVVAGLRGGSASQRASAVVRPHDIELTPTAPTLSASYFTGGVWSSEATPAPASTNTQSLGGGRLLRATRIGANMKIELELDDGQPLTVALALERYEEMRLAQGDRVFVSLREARIFVDDFSI